MIKVTNFILRNGINFYGLIDYLINDGKVYATRVLLDMARTLALRICQVLYPLIPFFYNLFLTMAKINLLSDVEVVNTIYKRINILLGLITFFIAAFYLIRLLLDPDKINDKELGVGNLLKRIIISLLLIGFIPTIFRIAWSFQSIIIKDDIIGKVFVTYNVSDSNKNKHGHIVAAELFRAFYYTEEGAKLDDDDEDNKECLDDDYVISELIEEGTLSTALYCLNVTGKLTNTIQSNENRLSVRNDQHVYIKHFDGLLAIGVGAIMIWMLIVYTINIGIRTVQLAYLQIIAPVPIISYIYPKKDSMLTRWVKQCITTYADLFTRMSIISLVFYMASIVTSIDIDSQLTGLSAATKIWLKVMLIIALFIFGKRAPQLLQELTGKPSAASIGFGLGGSNAAAGFLMGAATVGAMNFAGSTGGARFTGLAKGILSGGSAGATSGNYSQNMERAKQKARKSNETDEWLKLQGYGFAQRMANRAVVSAGGIPTGRRREYMKFLDENYKNILKDDDNVKPYSAAKQQQLTYGNDVSKYMEEVGGAGSGRFGIRDFDGNIGLEYDTNSGTVWRVDHDRGGTLYTQMTDENGNGLSLAQALDQREKEKLQKAANNSSNAGVVYSGEAVRLASRHVPGRRRAYIQDTVHRATHSLPGLRNNRGLNYSRFSKNMKKNSARATRTPPPPGSSGMPR